MQFIDSSGSVISFEELKALFPWTSFPATPKQSDMPLGYMIVNPVSAPAGSPYYAVTQTTPVQNAEGFWTEAWQEIPLPLATAQQIAIANLAQARYTAQTTPVTVGNVTVNTTPDSITMLNSAISSLADATATVNFKAVSGWAQLNLAQLQALADAVNAQIQACFTNEFNLTQQIMALTDTPSVAAFDINTGWQNE
jgi:hypothetical protein